MSEEKDKATEITEIMVARSRAMERSMDRLRELRRLHEAITIGVSRSNEPPKPVTSVVIEAAYRKVTVDIAEAFPDLATNLAVMIAAEDARLNDERVAFVADINEAWGKLEPSPTPREPDRLHVSRPVNLEG